MPDAAYDTSVPRYGDLCASPSPPIAGRCSTGRRAQAGEYRGEPPVSQQWRGIATRYEKTATIYLAGLHIAGIFLWSAR